VGLEGRHRKSGCRAVPTIGTGPPRAARGGLPVSSLARIAARRGPGRYGKLQNSQVDVPSGAAGVIVSATVFACSATPEADACTVSIAGPMGAVGATVIVMTLEVDPTAIDAGVAVTPTPDGAPVMAMSTAPVAPPARVTSIVIASLAFCPTVRACFDNSISIDGTGSSPYVPEWGTWKSVRSNSV
jgi:hypothetical protein